MPVFPDGLSQDQVDAINAHDALLIGQRRQEQANLMALKNDGAPFDALRGQRQVIEALDAARHENLKPITVPAKEAYADNMQDLAQPMAADRPRLLDRKMVPSY